MIKINKLDSGGWAIVIATALFILPIMLSGILYQDDILRSANGEPYWGVLGRPLSDVVVMALGFGNGYVIDAFPFSLVVAGALLGASSLILYSRFALQRGISSGIVFSLFSLSPFILQNLSYRFDCFPMMLGVFLAALPYSVAVSSLRPWVRVATGTVCLVMALSLYQATINVFLSLCAIEIIYLLYTNRSGTNALRVSIERALSAALSMLVYMKGITPFYLSKNVHSDLVTKAENPAESLMYNIDRFWNIANSLMNHSLFMAWILALIVAIAGLIFLAIKIIKSEESPFSKFVAFLVITIGIIVTAFSVTGPFVFIDKTVVAPRVMMGLPGLMLLVGYLASTIGNRKASAFVCIIPVVFSLSYASAYGNASKSQRSLEDKVFYEISSSIPRNLEGKKIYISGQIATSPATNMEFKRFPSLKWMVMPLYSWSGMVMLKQYGIEAEMGVPPASMLVNKSIATRFFDLDTGSGIHIKLK